MRFLFSTLAVDRYLVAFILTLGINSLFAQLLVEPTGSVGVGDVSNFTDVRLRIDNPGLIHGLYLSHGKNGQLRDITGIYNTSDDGEGDRTGLFNYLRSSGGYVKAIYNDIGSGGTESMIGVVNRMQNGGKGAKTGIYNSIKDQGENGPGSTQPMYGVRTSLRHHYRPQVFGSEVTILSRDDDPTHTEYGYYAHITGREDGGVQSYGVYSYTPGPSNYAGYFVGNVSVNGAMVLTSDARLKQDAGKVNSALEIVRQLKPQHYRFQKGNRFNYDEQRVHYGFMAQDIESVLPGLVHDIAHPPVLEAIEEATDNGRGVLNAGKGKVGEIVDSFATVVHNEQTFRVVHPAETLKGVRYTDLIAVLTGAMQEQQGMIEELGAEISDLKQELENLRECTKCSGSSQFPQMRTTSPDNGSSVKSTSESKYLQSPTNSIILYPNPAANEITVSTTNGIIVRAINAYNSGGKLIASYEPNMETFKMNTSLWISGNYIIEVLDAAENLEKHIVSIVK